MTTPTLSIKRRGGRFYQNPLTERDDYMGVTSILNAGIPKHLKAWAQKLCAEYAVENRKKWKNLDAADAVEMIKKAPDRYATKAANKGTTIHDMFERRLLGERVTDFQRAELGDVAGTVEAQIDRWLQDWAPTPIHTELTVFNDEFGYAGTLDFIAALPGIGPVLGDLKTGKSVYGDVALQLCAYANADYGIIPDGDGWLRVDLPEIDTEAALVVHLNENVCDTYPVDIGPDTYDALMAAIGVAGWTKIGSKNVVGDKLTPPEPLPTDTIEPAADPEVSETTEQLRTNIQRRYNLIVALGKQSDEFRMLKEGWPPGVPTLKHDGHTRDQLHQIRDLLIIIEGFSGAPFDPPPLTTEGPEPEDLEAMRLKIGRLPSDLRASFDLAASHLPSLDGRANNVTADDLVEYGKTADTALDMLAGRNDMIHAAFKGLNDEQRDIIADLRPGDMTMTDVRAIQGLAALISQDVDPFNTESVAVYLERSVGRKGQVRDLGKQVAEKHRMLKPKSAGDVAANPILAALVYQRHTATNP